MAIINRNTIENYRLLEEDGMDTGKADYFWNKIITLFGCIRLTNYKYTKTVDCSKCRNKTKIGFSG